jgi:hypothetical protein
MASVVRRLRSFLVRPIAGRFHRSNETQEWSRGNGARGKRCDMDLGRRLSTGTRESSGATWTDKPERVLFTGVKASSATAPIVGRQYSGSARSRTRAAGSLEWHPGSARGCKLRVVATLSGETERGAVRCMPG